ncbi:acyl carrier protein [Streptomyces sp. RB6PN25]|uniref:Acyl carrier protein n=1 Tax=Streptomyces humicola TaxID=2953240 RepID=A0ABT1PTS8_9ACTN|nr:acyl carrier protein [Streptomyces humicola]MCQ4081079.1 acyl carrier protein [Streptomyces humicola]
MADAPLPDQYALDSVHCGLLDCIQVNLGVLADHVHGPGTHLRLGAELGFRWWQRADGLPTVDPPLAEQLTAAGRLLGLHVTARGRMGRDTMLRTIRERHTTHYVVADSYVMPWLPYHGHAHMEHSFLLTAGPDGWHVTDAYRNETQWGPAAPGHWILPDNGLAGIESAEVILLEPDGPAAAGQPPPVFSLDDTTLDAFLTAYDTCPDRGLALAQLTTETWLLARSRKLHAAYRTHVDTAGAGRTDETTTQHLRAWDKVVEQTYLAHRRVARGRAEPPGVVDRLRAVLADDRRVFGTAPAASTSEADETLRRRVAQVVATVLGVPETELLAGAPLSSFPAFSSFRLVEIIERLESELDMEIDPDRLIPEDLHRLDNLCRLAS